MHFELLISTPRPGVSYYKFLLLTAVRLSIRLSVTDKLQTDSSFLFLDGIEPFFGHPVSMWHSTKRCSWIFDLGPLTPKINSPKLHVITLHYHVATRGRTLGSSAPAWRKSATH